MTYSWQELIVLAAVAWAAWRVLGVVRGTLAQARTGACGGGCGCDKTKNAATDGDRPIVEIGLAKRPETTGIATAEKRLSIGQHSQHGES